MSHPAKRDRAIKEAKQKVSTSANGKLVNVEKQRRVTNEMGKTNQPRTSPEETSPRATKSKEELEGEQTEAVVEPPAPKAKKQKSFSNLFAPLMRRPSSTNNAHQDAKKAKTSQPEKKAAADVDDGGQQQASSTTQKDSKKKQSLSGKQQQRKSNKKPASTQKLSRSQRRNSKRKQRRKQSKLKQQQQTSQNTLAAANSSEETEQQHEAKSKFLDKVAYKRNSKQSQASIGDSRSKASKKKSDSDNWIKSSPSESAKERKIERVKALEEGEDDAKKKRAKRPTTDRKSKRMSKKSRKDSGFLSNYLITPDLMDDGIRSAYVIDESSAANKDHKRKDKATTSPAPSQNNSNNNCAYEYCFADESQENAGSPSTPHRNSDKPAGDNSSEKTPDVVDSDAAALGVISSYVVDVRPPESVDNVDSSNDDNRRIAGKPEAEEIDSSYIEIVSEDVEQQQQETITSNYAFLHSGELNTSAAISKKQSTSLPGKNPKKHAANKDDDHDRNDNKQDHSPDTLYISYTKLSSSIKQQQQRYFASDSDSDSEEDVDSSDDSDVDDNSNNYDEVSTPAADSAQQRRQQAEEGQVLYDDVDEESVAPVPATSANNKRNSLGLPTIMPTAIADPVAEAKHNNIGGGSDHSDADDDSVQALIERTPAETLKRILLNHAKDDRARMLSRVTESVLAEQTARKKAGEDLLGVRQWNEEYQDIVKVGYTAFTSKEVNRLAELCHDFVSCAETYAKIIVNELGVPYDEKTIKPAGVGGIAGGAKYIVHGILFKFCLDAVVSTRPTVLYMYGGNKPRDDHAMKAGGLELQGLEIWGSQLVPGLHFPLMALIDYKGFRLVATSLLPLGKNTLRYGSADGGKTVSASDEKLNEAIRTAAQRINLKGHTVGKSETLIYGPGDIEGHKGKDGRYYLLDFARTMPPEAPKYDKNGVAVEPRAVFYKMLRPELVHSNKVPLSSDVFSGWGLKDKNKEQSQREVVQATRRIKDECIPALVKDLLAIDLDAISNRYFITKRKHTTPAHMRKFMEAVRLPLRMHARGINLRYLGHVRQHMDHPYWRILLMSLAIARVLRTKLREKMRNVMKVTRSSEIEIKKLVAEFFNDVLFSGTRQAPSKQCALGIITMGEIHKDSQWAGLDLLKELEAKYEGILTDEEKQMSMHEFSSSRFCVRLVIAEFLHLKTIKMTPEAGKALFRAVDYSVIRLVESDIEEVCSTVKYGHVHNVMDALKCQIMAVRTSPVPLPSTLRGNPLRDEDLTTLPATAVDLQAEMGLGRAAAPATAPAPPSPTEILEIKDMIRTSRDDKAHGVDAADDNDDNEAEEARGEHEKAEIAAKSAQTMRLLKRAEADLFTGYTSYPLCPFTTMVWGRVLTDMATIRELDDWDKAKLLFERAGERFAAALSTGSGFQALFESWAEYLRQYALQAKKHGEEGKARELVARAERMYEESKVSTPGGCSFLKATLEEFHALRAGATEKVAAS